MSAFPLDETTLIPCVEWPTRAGNLIAAYEQYPSLKYGADSIFYWPRIWLDLSKDLRDEIDNQQSISDGALYASFSFLIASSMILMTQLLDHLTGRTFSFFQDFNVFHAIFHGVVSLMLSVFSYRMSLQPLEQFGDTFRSVFDKNPEPLKSHEWMVDQICRETHDNLARSDLNERNRIIWRYLKWQRVRMKGEERNRIRRLR